MTLKGLILNVEREKQILKEIFSLNENLFILSKKEEKEIIEKKISSLIKQLELLNDSIPSIIENISFFKELPSSSKSKGKQSPDILDVSYTHGSDKVNIMINKKDREKFMNELRIDRDIIERLKRKKIPIQTGDISDIKKPNLYKKISNKVFLNMSTQLFKKGHFKGLENNLRKASVPFLPNSYLSMALFSSLITFLICVLSLTLLVIISPPNLLKYGLIALFLPIFTFFAFYLYPVTESQGMGQKIKNELPFVSLHMAAISGSKIEPSQIFKIIAFGTEYPNTKKEFTKIINQTNLYGYDLITALKNVSRNTPSKALSELLSGIATTISSGGDITEFLNKRSETLFFEYRMDREKYTKEAETFMDIYISLVIAAPMVLSLLLVLMNIGVMNIGIPMSLLNILMIGGIALINVIFIIFLNLKQVNY
jgi:Flp pilus assembly protein TadB